MHRILSIDKSASEKAEALLLERIVNELSEHEWSTLIAEVPEDVKKEIGLQMSAGIAPTCSRNACQ